MRHNLPSGGWIESLNPREVTERRRRPVKQVAAKFSPDTPVEKAIEIYDEMMDLVSVALIESWSYPLPVEVDSLLDLQGEDVDAIRAIVEPLVPQLLPDFSANAVGDPKALSGS